MSMYTGGDRFCVLGPSAVEELRGRRCSMSSETLGDDSPLREGVLTSFGETNIIDQPLVIVPPHPALEARYSRRGGSK